MQQIQGTALLVKANGISISYDNTGSGEIPVIFIHGFPFDRTMWDPQVSALHQRYRLITYDIRGFGKTEAGAEEASISLYADDLIAFMDILEIKKAIVCGLSMGGYILLNAVNRYPERFAGLVFCDTQCNADTPEGKEKRFLSIQKIESGGLSEYVDGLMKAVFAESTFVNNKEVTESIRKTMLATSPQAIISALKALAHRDDRCELLDEIDCTALIVCGKEDKITPPQKSEFMQAAIAGSSMKVIDNAGHLSTLEQPQEFNAALSDFIAGLLR